jgi:hypothetical protein
MFFRRVCRFSGVWFPMSEPDKEPSITDLLKRIVQLEGMAALVKKQQGEINSLKATIPDLGGAFKLHVTDTANNLKMSMTSYGPWFTKCSQEAPNPAANRHRHSQRRPILGHWHLDIDCVADLGLAGGNAKIGNSRVVGYLYKAQIDPQPANSQLAVSGPIMPHIWR